MSYVAINYSKKKRHCGKCHEAIANHTLYVEVINQRNTTICAACITSLADALSGETVLPVREALEKDISKSDISV